ncbi:hypothetical protein GCM10011613_00750 [Cellvibrio zantedeschiae]|uniref:Lipoprotein n=1 Tax=Cellvibrio zantedeschiae TaxID=1237077 RepID=A0ABQ3AP86_9GAMM|nr:beta-propeller domain-containing protein [Cellvibrio zantedeschiae]GGY61217.1 hypothetical protein GCM10011613_00750 [Cellvibrio zantedeschiae]
MKKIIQCLCISVPLVACGGGGGGSTDTPRLPPQVKTDYSNLKQSKLEPGPLKQVTATDLTDMVKNGLRISLRDNQNFNELARTATLSGDKASLANGSKTSGDFSGTNVQVENVDEADVVKYDGRYIFAATPVNYTDAGPKAELKIFATNPATATSTSVSTTAIDTTYWGDISDLYLVSDASATSGLVTIRRSMNFMYFAKTLNAADGPTPDVPETRAAQESKAAAIVAGDDKRLIMPQDMDRGVEISLYDVRTPASPSKAWTVTLDGDLLASRKIGNTLYLVTSFVPAIPDLRYGVSNKEELTANENLIASTPVEKLLPNYAINGGADQPLNKESCLVSANAKANEGYLNLINITTIDLSKQKLVNSVCINTNVEGVYSSLNNLYLGGSDPAKWQDWSSFSVIHQFKYTDTGVSYVASGGVEGILGWGEPSYRMDEYKDALRVITTRYGDKGEPTHQLNVLQKVAGKSELAVVAQLPNKTQPEAIGKPREDIYAVRFNGDRAFVVTFERKDPLYVLDLADTKNPKIAGQLEIPCFSTFLRPIGKDFVFSLGNETDAEGRQAGVKVALYDVRDITKPVQVSSQVFGDAGSWSEALYDYHALSFLQRGDDQLRVTLPMVLYKTDIGKDFWNYTWLNTGLHMFEVNGLVNGKASLDYVGNLISESSTTAEYPSWSGSDRSLLHDNAVFYVHDSKVNGSFWPVKK